MLTSENELNARYMLMHLFVSEAQSKSRHLLSLFNTLNHELREPKNDIIFLLLQSILLHSAQLSLIFFPIEKKYRARGQSLIGAFRIPEQIQKLSDRKVRNHIAHMDERLHEWSMQSPNRIICRQIFGPRSSIGGDAIAHGDVFEHYIPEERKLIFRGDEFDMQELATIASAIHERASQIAALAWWSDEFKRLF